MDFSSLVLTVEEGNGNPLQYSCLENPVDRGAWWAVVHKVTQSRTRLKRLSMHACIGEGNGNPLQYSCLENPRDRGAWWTAIYVRWSHIVGHDWSDLATAAVLTAHIFWQRTRKAVKWDLLTTREMFFFFLVSSQVEHLVRLKELATKGNNLNLLSYVKRQTAQSWPFKTLSLSFHAESLWSEDKLPEGLFLGGDMNYRLNLYTQTSKYIYCKLQNTWEICPITSCHALRLIILISKCLIILQNEV